MIPAFTFDESKLPAMLGATDAQAIAFRFSTTFELADKKRYFLSRERTEDGDWAYALCCEDTAQWETPYLSRAAIDIILHRRNGGEPETCPYCDGLLSAHGILSACPRDPIRPLDWIKLVENDRPRFDPEAF